MNSRVLWIAGGVAALGAVGWLGFSGGKAHDASQAATQGPVEFRGDPPDLPVAAPDPAPVAAPSGAPVALAVSAAPAPAPSGDPSAADERAVLGMYQNMADAVDAYGPTGCPGLGQAFTAFVNDAAPAVGRLVKSTKAKGQDFTQTFSAAHGPEVERVKVKLQEAIKNCGSDPGVRAALTNLAKAT